MQNQINDPKMEISALLGELGQIIFVSTAKTMIRALSDAIRAGDKDREAEMREAISAYVIYYGISAEESGIKVIYSEQEGDPNCRIVVDAEQT